MGDKIAVNNAGYTNEPRRKGSCLGSGFKILLVILVIGCLLYTPILLRDPAKQHGGDYGKYIRNGILPVPVYVWVLPGGGMNDFSSVAHYEFVCYVWPLEKYEYYGDSHNGTHPWLDGNAIPGIYNVRTSMKCDGYAKPMYVAKIY